MCKYQCQSQCHDKQTVASSKIVPSRIFLNPEAHKYTQKYTHPSINTATLTVIYIWKTRIYKWLNVYLQIKKTRIQVSTQTNTLSTLCNNTQNALLCRRMWCSFLEKCNTKETKFKTNISSRGIHTLVDINIERCIMSVILPCIFSWFNY